MTTTNPNDPKDLLFAHDLDTDVVSICGIEYRASVFRERAFAPLGSYFRIEQRSGPILVVRGFSKDIYEKFDKLAGIK